MHSLITIFILRPKLVSSFANVSMKCFTQTPTLLLHRSRDCQFSRYRLNPCSRQCRTCYWQQQVSCVPIQSVMEWRLDSARLIQALIFLLRQRLDASRHFLANFLVILDDILHLNFTDCFWRQRFCFKFQKTAYKPSPNFSFSSFISYLTLGRISPMHLAKKAQALFDLQLHH